jgi:tetratricopeptide (TPR) repeat protein
MEQAKELMVEIEMHEPLILLSLAELHLARGDTDKAIAEAKESLEMANRVRELEQIYLANVFLSDRFSEKEDYQAANVHLSKAMVYKDSIGYNQGLDQVEKIELKFKIKEQETALTNLQEKTKYRYTIYILAGIGVILLGILIMRQVKIIRMTENIHEIQNSLVKSELERRKMTPTSFQVTQKGDRELKDRV